jgi:hypothetical protein
MPQQLRLAVPSLGEHDAVGNTSDVDVDQQLVIKSAGGTSLPDVPLPEVHPDVTIGKKLTSPRIAKVGLVDAFGFASCCCLVWFLCCNQFSSRIEHYTRRKCFGSIRVCFIHTIIVDCPQSVYATRGKYGTCE